MDAICTQTCYDSTLGILYEQGRIYSVDPKDPFIQRYFDVPKPKAAPKADPK